MMFLCGVFKKLSIHMMKNDVDREKVSLFQQHRQTTAAKLSQVQNVGKHTKKTPHQTRCII